MYSTLLSVLVCTIASHALSSIPPGTASLQLGAPWPMSRRNQYGLAVAAFQGSNSNKTLWTTKLGGFSISSPVIGANNTLFITSTDGYLYSFESNGEKLWTTYLGGGSISSSVPSISADGVLYVGSYDHNLYAIHINGTVKWRFPTSQSIIYSSPVVSDDKVIYIASNDNTLYAIHSNGTQKWSTSGLGITSPILGADGIVYMCSGYKLSAVSQAGLVIWHYTVQKSPTQLIYPYSSAAIGVNDALHFVTSCISLFECFEGSTLYSVHKNGTLHWSYSTGFLNETVFGSPVVDTEGTIYFGGNSGTKIFTNPGALYAVTSTGRLKWNFTTTSGVTSSPAIDNSGVLFVGTYDGTMYALHTNNGQVLWVANIEAAFLNSPAIGNGVVFIGSSSSFNFRAIGLYEKCDILNPEYTATDMDVCIPFPTYFPSSSSPSSSSPSSSIPSSANPSSSIPSSSFPSSTPSSSVPTLLPSSSKPFTVSTIKNTHTANNGKLSVDAIIGIVVLVLFIGAVAMYFTCFRRATIQEPRYYSDGHVLMGSVSTRRSDQL